MWLCKAGEPRWCSLRRASGAVPGWLTRPFRLCPPLPLPAQVGLHQLVMQQTYTSLPPGSSAPASFGSQLGLSASWLGTAPSASGQAPQSSTGMGMGPTLAGFEALSSMSQQLLPAWAVMLQQQQQPCMPAAASLDFAPSGGTLGSLPIPALPAAAAKALPAGGAPAPAPASAPMAVDRAERPASGSGGRPARSGSAGAVAALAGHKRTASPRPSGELCAAAWALARAAWGTAGSGCARVLGAWWPALTLACCAPPSLPACRRLPQEATPQPLRDLVMPWPPQARTAASQLPHASTTPPAASAPTPHATHTQTPRIRRHHMCHPTPHLMTPSRRHRAPHNCQRTTAVPAPAPQRPLPAPVRLWLGPCDHLSACAILRPASLHTASLLQRPPGLCCCCTPAQRASTAPSRARAFLSSESKPATPLLPSPATRRQALSPAAGAPVLSPACAPPRARVHQSTPSLCRKAQAPCTLPCVTLPRDLAGPLSPRLPPAGAHFFDFAQLCMRATPRLRGLGCPARLLDAALCAAGDRFPSATNVPAPPLQ